MLHADSRAGKLETVDPVVFGLAKAERRLQRRQLYLLAASSVLPEAIREAMATDFTNLDLEGYPSPDLRDCNDAELTDIPARLRAHWTSRSGKYNGGTALAEVVEEIARRRAIELFDANGRLGLHVNIQAATGAIAVSATLRALAQPGDTVLYLDVASGGHLSHGSRLHLSGKEYRCVCYGLAADEKALDYAGIARLVATEHPRVLIAGFSSFPRTIDWQALRAALGDGASRCLLIADISHIAGLVAAGVFPSPVSVADATVFATYKTFLGPRGSVILARNSAVGRAIDRAVFPLIQSSPVSSQLVGIAVAIGIAGTSSFAHLQRQIVENARVLAAALPRYGIDVAFGGTDSHIVAADFRNRRQGAHNEAGAITRSLERVGIIVNANMLPGDVSGAKPSGIRLGLTWATQCGCEPQDMELIAQLVSATVHHQDRFGTEYGSPAWEDFAQNTTRGVRRLLVSAARRLRASSATQSIGRSL